MFVDGTPTLSVVTANHVPNGNTLLSSSFVSSAEPVASKSVGLAGGGAVGAANAANDGGPDYQTSIHGDTAIGADENGNTIAPVVVLER